jgi:hypothetical protein
MSLLSLLHLLRSGIGPSLQFEATQQFGRFPGQSRHEPSGNPPDRIENDPK